MLIEKIEVPYLNKDLLDEKNYQYDMKEITLCENRIEYTIKYRCDSLSEDKGTWDEDVLRYTHSVFNKCAIVGLIMIYDYTQEVWATRVIITNDMLDIHVNTKKEALTIFQKIHKWLYNEQEESKTIEENSTTSEHG